MRRVIKVDDLKNMEFIKLLAGLIYDNRYRKIKAEGKILYSLLLNLISLSIKNNWVNEKGEAFVLLSRKKIKEFLNIGSSNTISKIMKELRDFGLIEERSNSQNEYNEIYIYVIEKFNRDIKISDKRKEIREYIKTKEIIVKDKGEQINKEKEQLYDRDFDNRINKLREEIKNGIHKEYIATKSIATIDNILIKGELAIKNEPSEVQKVSFPSFENRSYINNNKEKNNFKNLNLNQSNIENYINREDTITKSITGQSIENEVAISTNFIAEEELNNDFVMLLGAKNEPLENEKVFGFEKTEIETVKEIYGEYSLTDSEAKTLLKVANNNLYVIDIAHEQAMENIKNIRNFFAYNIAVIKNMD